MTTSVTTPLLSPPPPAPTSTTPKIPTLKPHDNQAEIEANAPASDPKRHLSLFDGIAIVLGLQIGSGIFSSPSLVLANVASEPTALAVWVGAGLLAWVCAACYIELGTRLPVNGGPQEYLAACFNELCGFVASWACVFVIKPCSAAILAVVIADYICNALSVGASGWARKGAAVAVVAVVTAINCAGNKSSTVTTKTLLACKIISLGFVIVMGFVVLVIPPAKAAPSNVAASMQFEPLMRPSFSNYTDATLAAMWAYSGWETLALVGGEVKNPGRNIALVINISMVIIITLFVLANVSYFSTLSYEEIVKSSTIGLTFSKHFLGRAGGGLYVLVICLSTLGSLNVKVFTAGRLTQAAVERGFLPPLMKNIGCDGSESAEDLPEVRARSYMLEFMRHPIRYGDGSIPLSSIIFNGLLAVAFIMLGTFSSLITFVGIVEYSIVFATIVGLLILRLRPISTDAKPNRVIVRVPWMVIFIALGAIAIMISISITRHPYSSIGFIAFCVVNTGIYKYLIWSKIMN